MMPGVKIWVLVSEDREGLHLGMFVSAHASLEAAKAARPHDGWMWEADEYNDTGGSWIGTGMNIGFAIWEEEVAS